VQTGPYAVKKKGGKEGKAKAPERDQRQTISWHVHLLVWGVSRAALKALVDEVSEAPEPRFRTSFGRLSADPTRASRRKDPLYSEVTSRVSGLAY
jgi:hypothetical protein